MPLVWCCGIGIGVVVECMWVWCATDRVAWRELAQQPAWPGRDVDDDWMCHNIACKARVSHASAVRG